MWGGARGAVLDVGWGLGGRGSRAGCGVGPGGPCWMWCGGWGAVLDVGWGLRVRQRGRVALPGSPVEDWGGCVGDPMARAMF